jgi:hypothetical protein
MLPAGRRSKDSQHGKVHLRVLGYDLGNRPDLGSQLPKTKATNQVSAKGRNLRYVARRQVVPGCVDAPRRPYDADRELAWLGFVDQGNPEDRVSNRRDRLNETERHSSRLKAVVVASSVVEVGDKAAPW